MERGKKIVIGMGAYFLVCTVAMIWPGAVFANRVEPMVFGLPFFYWVQFGFVPVGVVCVAIVYLKTRTQPTVPVAGPDRGVDDLDEGAVR